MNSPAMKATASDPSDLTIIQPDYQLDRPGRQISLVVTLADILAPLSAEHFIGSYAGQRPCLIRGHAAKFQGLFSWPELNRTLVQRWLDYPRIRLVRNAETLPPARYVNHQVGRRGQTNPIVRTDRVEHEMRRGAMLHLASVEELNEAIRALANDAAGIFKTNVFVNLHAGLQASRGFDVHWDGHDVLVLQVSGKKLWRLYGVTVPHPLAVSPLEKTGAPTSMVWEGMLEQGDVLYLPRGYWHAAKALEEPTLHLTIGVVNSTGLDFLAWMSRRLEHEVEFRRDIPTFGTIEEKNQYLHQLKSRLATALTNDTLEDFLKQKGEAITVPKAPHLP